MSNLIAIAPQFPLSWPQEAGQLKVHQMRQFIVAAALVAATATTPAPAPILIQQVDTVSVSVEHNLLVVTAKGAVNSGGWTLPHLQRRPAHIAEADTDEFEFLATPPPANSAVVQALIPVSVSSHFSLPRYGTVQVKVVAQSNSVTVPLH
jgi:hypothetical protein